MLPRNPLARPSRRARVRRPSPLLAAALVAASAAPALAAAPATATAASARPGTLTVVVSGLPKGQSASVGVRGPGLRRTIRARRTVLRRLRPGRYVVSARKVRVARAAGRVRKGSTVLPVAAVTRITVGRKPARQTAKVRYGTVVNPGVRALPKRIGAVRGDRTKPSAIVVPRSRAYRTGGLLTAGLSGALPDGLVARITKVVRRGRNVELRLRPAAISEVVPRYVAPAGSSIALTPPNAARRAAPFPGGPLDYLPCGGVQGSVALKGGAGIRNARAANLEWESWPPRLAMDVNMDLYWGWGVELAGKLECSFSESLLHRPFLVPVGGVPIPAYFDVSFSIKAQAELSGAYQYEAVRHVAARVDSDARDKLTVRGNTEAKTKGSLGFDLGASAAFTAELGLGVKKAANVYVNFAPKLKFDAKPWSDGCALNLDFGGAIGGRLGLPLKSRYAVEFGPLTYQLGSVELWRRLDCWKPDQPSAPATAVAIDREHGCAVANGGAVRCWGTDVGGRMGDAQLGATRMPVTALAGVDTRRVDVDGGVGSCAVVSDSLLCWGIVGTRRFERPATVIAGGVGDVSIGYRQACAISGGSVACWGDDALDVLGRGTGSGASEQPVTVPGTAGAADVASGYDNDCAVVGGAVKCWGRHTVKIEPGKITREVVTAIPSGATAVDVSRTMVDSLSGAARVCAVVGGAVKCWNSDDTRDLAAGDAEPETIVSSGATAVSVGDEHVCAIVSGAVQCWGDNDFGQLGDGTTAASKTPVTPIRSGAVAVSAGNGNSCAILTDGVLQCWGTGQEQQFGSKPALTPTTILGL
ncbi:RCC1 domain-containing protein [Patulibacter defluvii]|uniref:RCC1 domain-containing protein n=1 Tax=Patulibacter defluvii TaxID=3095358 RepID=UPI002A7579B1|nr:hypothetical protein [Patulibacter sp. DM4]